MRLRGFSGSDPTFLAISISLALTCPFGPRAWEGRDCTDLSIVQLVAIVVAALLIRPRSRRAWIAGALTALLTWQFFAPYPYCWQKPWLYAIPIWIGSHSPYGHDEMALLLILFLLYLAPIVVATAAVRLDLGLGARAARAGSALLGAVLLWVLGWSLMPLRGPLNPYALRYLQVAVYLAPSVVAPLLVWRLTLIRRPEPQWVIAAVATPLASVALFALLEVPSLDVVTERPIGCVLLAAFALAGPLWTYRDRSARRRNAESHGFDVVLTSSVTPQQ